MDKEGIGTNKNFLEHPVYVAGIAVAGTIVLLVTLFKEVVLPAQMASAEFKNQEMQRAIDKILTEQKVLQLKLDDSVSSSGKEKVDSDRAMTAIKARLESVLLELNEYKVGSLYMDGGIYPVGFDKVKVGEPIERVREIYKDFREDDESAYISLDVSHPFFKHLTFYYDEQTKKVYQIMLSADYADRKFDEGFLQGHLERAFGTPLKLDDKRSIWQVGDKFILKDEPYSYIIAAHGVTPGGWGRPLERFSEKLKVLEENSKKKN